MKGCISGIQDAELAYYILGTTLEIPVPKSVVGESKSLEIYSTRRSPRIRLQIPVFVRGADASGAEFIELTKTLNISAFGACIACQHVLRANRSVQLTIPTPSPAIPPSFVPSETPPIIARVLRQNTVGETRLFGLEFVHPLD